MQHKVTIKYTNGESKITEFDDYKEACEYMKEYYGKPTVNQVTYKKEE